jgi:hypothetical protein
VNGIDTDIIRMGIGSDDRSDAPLPEPYRTRLQAVCTTARQDRLAEAAQEADQLISELSTQYGSQPRLHRGGGFRPRTPTGRPISGETPPRVHGAHIAPLFGARFEPFEVWGHARRSEVRWVGPGGEMFLQLPMAELVGAPSGA